MYRPILNVFIDMKAIINTHVSRNVNSTAVKTPSLPSMSRKIYPHAFAL